MEKITVLKVYNLLNSKGNTLQLRLGILESNQRKYEKDTGCRWSFVGTNIPMPVRSGTWFNGFPADTMLSWLDDNGWHLRVQVNMLTGKAHAYDLPKGNAGCDVPDCITNAGQWAINEAIRTLVHNGNMLAAIHLYRYCYPCSMSEARGAVSEIIDQQK